jgi:nitronate monooxygenase
MLDQKTLNLETDFTRHARIAYPIICGAMYPCSNPELVAAASEAGGIGIIQPISLTYVHKYDFRQGIRYIRTLTQKPIGFNLLIEKSVKRYEDQMKAWLDIALEEGVRFFITALGNPRWVVERVRPLGGIVYHDVVNRKWAEKALESDVDGLICVNNQAGGHLGSESPERLIETLRDLGKPLICAGGIGDEEGFARALKMGYAGIQMGTRFIATTECKTHPDYKDAILKARAADIVATEKISGVPVAVINSPYIQRMGLKAGPIARLLLKNSRTKHLMRTFYALNSLRQFKNTLEKGSAYKDYWQAGKSVEGIESVEPAGDIIRRFVDFAGR